MLDYKTLIGSFSTEEDTSCVFDIKTSNLH